MASIHIKHNQKKKAAEIFRTAHNVIEYHEGIDRVYDRKLDPHGRSVVEDAWSKKNYSSLVVNPETRKGSLYIVSNRWYDFDY